MNTIDFIQVSVKANTAWAAFNNHAAITMDDKHRLMSWLESAVLIKEEGIWKIQLFHSTVQHDETK